MNLKLDEFLHLRYVKYDLLIFFGWKSGHSPQILFKPLVVLASRYTTGQKLQEIHVSLLRSSLLLSLLYHYYHHSKCVIHTKILLFLFMIWNYCVLFWHVYGVLNCLLYYYHFLFWHISFRFTFMSTFHHLGMIFDVPIPTEKKNKPRQYKAIFVDFELPRLIPTRYSFRRFPSIPSSGVSPLGK